MYLFANPFLENRNIVDKVESGVVEITLPDNPLTDFPMFFICRTNVYFARVTYLFLEEHTLVLIKFAI